MPRPFLPVLSAMSLLDPEAERVERRRRNQRQLVASVERTSTHHQTEPDRRVRDRLEAARFAAASIAIDHPTISPTSWPISAEGHHAEEGQRRVASADVGRVD